jgi:cell cycle checkpoint protein
MAPPAKRRRRDTVDASDDDDGDQPRSANTLTNFFTSSLSSPPKPQARPSSQSPSKPVTKASPKKSAAAAAATKAQKKGASPSTRRSKDFFNGSEKGKSADLKTLFSRQTQRTSGLGQTKATLPAKDVISDPISDDDDISELKASTSSFVGKHARKRARNGAQFAAPLSTAAPSLRFLKPSKPFGTESSDEEARPWSERFGPRNLDELAVHKKKVSDVKRWLDDVMAGRLHQRVLILKGAAGSGKTTTMRLLAKDMSFELLEWKNPTNTPGLGFVSASAQFDEFLGRGSKFGALDLDDDSQTPFSTPNNSAPQDQPRQVMLIEEFPNTFSRSSTALTSFRNSLLGYLARDTPSSSFLQPESKKDPVKPVVMIISEALLTTTSSSADSFTAHRLLGPDLLRHPGVKVIEFNAIAPTILAKALDLVVQKEARRSGRKKTPGPAVLKRLGEIGDIRSAISSLEFLCLKGDQEADWGSRVAFINGKKSVRDGIALTKSESESLELISQREASLGMFHAVGKVVYNKRDPPVPGDKVENLPFYLSHLSRPRRSQVSVDTLIDETGTDTSTFISALHENFAASCEGADDSDLTTPMEYLNDCIEALSLSDLVCPSREFSSAGRGGGFLGADSGSHILRQDEIAFQVAVRGLLFALPYPVRRKPSTALKGADAFKMYYPMSLKLWRARENLEGLVDVWSSRLLKGEFNAATKNLTDGAGAFRKPKQPSDLSWMHRQHQNRQQQSVPKAPEPENADNDGVPILSLGSAARRELLLERLPYMAHIARGNRAKSGGIRLQDLEKVVSFKGIGAGDEGSSDTEEEDTSAREAWATDKPSEEASPKKRAAGVKADSVTTGFAQKLVLSDDDIED